MFQGMNLPRTEARLRTALLAFLGVCGCASPSRPGNQPPSVLITAPAQGTVVSRGDKVVVEVTATDADGSVQLVNLYLGGTLLATDASGPYRFEWDTGDATLGRSVLVATALDNEGSTSSGTVTLRITWDYNPPDRLGDGWDTSTLAGEGFDTARVRVVMDDVHDELATFARAILMARNGKLVLEEYFGDFAHNVLHHIQSSTKSIASAMIGIANDRGEIDGVDEPMARYLPQYAHLFDEGKERITIEHCLMMAAGLEWNEHSVPYSDPRNDNTIGNNGPDYVAHALSRPLIFEPGTFWYYNSGCSMILGAILWNATGLGADEYGARHLFEPMGISRYYWWPMNGGHISTHGGLSILPRDMAKFGQLFLDRGVWDGTRVISEEWVLESTRPRLTASGGARYGYQWWFMEMNGYDVHFAAGGGGQYIYFVPELRLVAVTAADPVPNQNTGTQEQYLLSLFRNRLLPAVLPTSVIPENSPRSRTSAPGPR